MVFRREWMPLGNKKRWNLIEIIQALVALLGKPEDWLKNKNKKYINAVIQKVDYEFKSIGIVIKD